MADMKTGIFAKNVQKRLNRAQEKVKKPSSLPMPHSSPLNISVVFCWLPSNFIISFLGIPEVKATVLSVQLMNSKQQRGIVAIDPCLHL
ncbi:hypothetical protein TURU_034435 [Turdus rufiventris]|nr:hypothetical protein TURU_034435 [Turdus rufiventris]